MKKKAETREGPIQKGTRRRREHEKEELRQTILKTAGELLLQLGYERFSMRQLAKRIGYSATTLYLYFRDKDDLLFTVVDESFTCFKKQLTSAATSSDDSWERLVALSHAYISFGLQNPVYYQLMFMQRADFLTQPNADEQPRLEMFRILQEAVQYAMDAGVMQPGNVEAYGDILWVMAHGIVAMAISIPTFDRKRIQRLTTVLGGMIFQAFSQQ